MLQSKERLQQMDADQQLLFAGEVFSKIAEGEGVFVSTDFLPLSLRAMKQLASRGRSNVPLQGPRYPTRRR